MPDLRQQLQACCQGRICLMGIGNVDLGDDGLGVQLAEKLADMGPRRTMTSGAGKDQPVEVVLATTMPERFIGRIVEQGFDHVIFLDAVEFGGRPGDVIWLAGDEIASRFPQISTHKLSLGLLSKWLASNQQTKAWLLGVQPGSLKPGQEISPPVQATLEVIWQLLNEVLYHSTCLSLAPRLQPGAGCRESNPAVSTAYATGAKLLKQPSHRAKATVLMRIAKPQELKKQIAFPSGTVEERSCDSMRSHRMKEATA